MDLHPYDIEHHNTTRHESLTRRQNYKDIRNTIVPWPFQHMSIKSFINYETFISTSGIFLNIHYFLSFTIFFDLEEINFETFNISENNIISVELAKVLG
jgi:hypothetical protein